MANINFNIMPKRRSNDTLSLIYYVNFNKEIYIISNNNNINNWSLDTVRNIIAKYNYCIIYTVILCYIIHTIYVICNSDIYRTLQGKENSSRRSSSIYLHVSEMCDLTPSFILTFKSQFSWRIVLNLDRSVLTAFCRCGDYTKATNEISLYGPHSVSF